MAERLIIQNFAGLNIDIELGRINIFIGPQASGKSVCIKCAHFLKGLIPSLLQKVIQDSSSPEELAIHAINIFTALLLVTENSEDFTIKHTNNEQFIQISSVDNKLSFTYSSYYNDLIDRARKASRKVIIPEKAVIYDDALYNRFKQAVNLQLGPFAATYQWFVPASRAIYSLIAEPKQAMEFSNDDYLSTFRVFYTALKKYHNHYQLNNQLIDIITKKIINAEFIQDNDTDYFTQSNGNKLPLTHASSGQQEILPIIIVLRYLAWPQISEPRVVYVEEPETHLHPIAQNAVAELIAAVFNASKSPLQFFLTTHTPYLLSSFNNLIYAGQLASKLKKNDSAGRKKLYAAVPKELHLNLADFRVYGLEDGKATLLIDEEFGLLMAHSIDSVSDIIADQFGDLMALDPANKPSTAN